MQLAGLRTSGVGRRVARKGNPNLTELTWVFLSPLSEHPDALAQ